jgi:hypothetical protein
MTKIYHYICEKCGHEENKEQKLGDPRTFACPVEGCDGILERVVRASRETVFDTYTPGNASQSHKENRSANEYLTKLRAKAGGQPITDPDHMAAERHMGKKNKVVPGSSKEGT